MTPVKQVVFSVVAFTLSVLVALALLEVGLRFAGPEYFEFNNRSYEYYSNPRGYFDALRTEGGKVIYGLPYRNTPEGYRDGPPSPVVSPQVLGLGDSFTYGRGVRYEDLYLTRLQAMLAAKGLPIGIKNAAVVGANIEEIYTFFTREAAKARFPLVLYGFVLNDFGLVTPNEIVGSDYIDINNGGHRYNPWRHYSALYNYLEFRSEQRRLDTATRRAYVAAFAGENARKKFDVMAQLDDAVKAQDGRLVVVLFPLLYDFDAYPFADIHAKIAAFCATRGIPLLDLLPALSRYKAEDLWAHPTDHHPNEIAHRVAAEQIYRFLNDRGLLTGLVAGQGSPGSVTSGAGAGH